MTSNKEANLYLKGKQTYFKAYMIYLLLSIVLKWKKFGITQFNLTLS